MFPARRQCHIAELAEHESRAGQGVDRKGAISWSAPGFLLPGHKAVLGVLFRRAGLQMVRHAGPRLAIDGRTRRQPYFFAGRLDFLSFTRSPCLCRQHEAMPRRAIVLQRHARLSRER